ncbi:MAG: T9SS type A sorting domain-containing protein [Candidatus Marinimicrobia bacterium]|nr:T9SS type A sorting domain-containing protein [Candidatus Neomarinimicrobiota bacterium]
MTPSYARTSLLIAALLTALPLSAQEKVLPQSARGWAAGQLAKSSRTSGLNGPDETVLNINNISLWVDRQAFFPWNSVIRLSLGNLLVAGEYPKGKGALIFTEGIVWGAKVDDQGSRDGSRARVRVSGNTFAPGLNPGKVLYDGSGVVTGGEDPADRHVWRVRRDYQTADLTEDAASFFVKLVEEVTAADLQALYDQYDYDWQNWPVGEGAPFEDLDGNGSYLATVDIPGVPGADQTIWLVANDLPPFIHDFDGDGVLDTLDVSPWPYASPPTGMELQLTLWAYDLPADHPLGNMLFKRARLIYTGLPDGPADAKLDTVYFAQWSDPDLDFFNDDFVGADTVLSLGYVYNGNVTDFIAEDFGLPVAAGGYDFLQGPIVAGDTLGMTAFTFFASRSPISDPDLGLYGGTLQFFNLMEGFLPRPEYPAQEPWLDPVTGQATKFALSGDPVAGQGWLDGIELPPGDRRLVMSTGPFAMALGDTQEVVLALIGALGVDNLTSVLVLRHYDRFAQVAYDNGFAQLQLPPAPVVVAAGLDGRVTLTWGDEAESFTSGGYQFEGYNVYLSAAPDGPWERLATFDITNGVGAILDEVVDSELGVPVTIPVQNGGDTGIQHFIEINADAAGQPLSNGQTYYISVNSYAYWSAPEAFPRTLESDFAPLEVMPVGPIAGTDYGGATADPVVTHSAGISGGEVLVTVVDPTQVTGHDYTITFGDVEGQLVWNLIDVDSGIVVLESITNQSGDLANPVVDGLLVQVFSNTVGFASNQHNEAAGIVEVAYGGTALTPAEYDLAGAPFNGNTVWHDSSSNGSYYVSAGGGAGNIERLAVTLETAGLHDLELRFTAEGSYGVWGFDFPGDTTGPVPFELWDIGSATPDDPSDDVRLVPVLFSGGGTLAVYEISADTPDPALGNPATDYVYFAHAPQPDYDNFAADAADGVQDDPPPIGSFLSIRRMIIGKLDGDVSLPPAGTTIRFNTNKPTTTADVFEFTTTAATPFTVEKGDVNADSLINIADVVMLINFILQIDAPTGAQAYAADYNSDLRLDIADVVGTVRAILGLGKVVAEAGPAEGAVALSIPAFVPVQDGGISLPVNLETDRPIAGLQFGLAYDPELLRPLPPRLMGAQWQGITVMHHATEDGNVLYLFYALQGGRTVPDLSTARFPFDVLNESAAAPAKLTLQNAVVADLQGEHVELLLGNTVASTQSLPEAFALHPNFPNPFNAQTVLRFDLPEGRMTKLLIYNLLGQTVRTLVSRDMGAGRHAIVWGGLDDQGHDLPSGIYFARLTTDDFVKTLKMTLLK